MRIKEEKRKRKKLRRSKPSGEGYSYEGMAFFSTRTWATKGADSY